MPCLNVGLNPKPSQLPAVPHLSYVCAKPQVLGTSGRLEYPDVPCLNVGTPRKPNYLPAELCQICPGQRRLKLDERQVGLPVGHDPPAKHAYVW